MRNPANYQCVALPKNVEKTPRFWAFAEAGRHTRHAMISQHQIRRKSNLERLGSLVLDWRTHPMYRKS